MDNLTTGELITLIELVDKEREGIRQASYEDKKTYGRYLDLGFISIKLNTMQKGGFKSAKRI